MPQEAYWRPVLLIAIICLGACRRGPCPEAGRVEVDYKGECIAELVYHENSADVVILPHPGCPWDRLVDLSLFDGFRPGMTIKQARNQFGPPESELVLGSNRLWRYQRPQAIVQIGYEDQGSGIIPFYYWWTLSAFPKEPSLGSLFLPEVVARLPEQKNYEVFVLNQCGLSMIIASIENGEVRVVNWTHNPGSYPAPQMRSEQQRH